MTMIPKATKQFLDFTIKSSESGFAGLLNSSSMPRLIDVSKDKGVSFMYRLVPYVCKKSLGSGSKASSTYQLPVSTAMVILNKCYLYILRHVLFRLFSFFFHICSVSTVPINAIPICRRFSTSYPRWLLS